MKVTGEKGKGFGYGARSQEVSRAKQPMAGTAGPAASDRATRHQRAKKRPSGNPGYCRRQWRTAPRGERPPTRGAPDPATNRRPVTAGEAVAILGSGSGNGSENSRELHQDRKVRPRRLDAKSHGRPVGKPLSHPVGWRPRRIRSRPTVCVRSERPARATPVLHRTSHAERTEAGPGPKQVATASVRYAKPAPEARSRLATGAGLLFINPATSRHSD